MDGKNTVDVIIKNVDSSMVAFNEPAARDTRKIKNIGLFFCPRSLRLPTAFIVAIIIIIPQGIVVRKIRDEIEEKTISHVFS